MTYPVTQARRRLRRIDAEERNKRFAALSHEQKIAHVKAMPGRAKKQRVKLGLEVA